MEWSRTAQHCDASNWLQWQWALQRAHLATLVLPPPPPPPLAESSSLSSDTELESLHCDASGNEDGLRTPAPLSPRSVSSHSKETATERRLDSPARCHRLPALDVKIEGKVEALRSQLLASRFFQGARLASRDRQLARRLRESIVIDAGSDLDVGDATAASTATEAQVERRARLGFAGLDQLVQARRPMPSSARTRVKLEAETIPRRRRRRGGSRGGRYRQPRKCKGKDKDKDKDKGKGKQTIPKWTKLPTRKRSKPSKKGMGKGKGRGNVRTPLPTPRAMPARAAMVTVTLAPRPSRKAWPSQSPASVTVSLG